MWRRAPTSSAKEAAMLLQPLFKFRARCVQSPRVSRYSHSSIAEFVPTDSAPFRTSANTTSSEPMLLDSYNRHHNYLRISITERCNLRCTYCMPEEGVALQPADKLLTTKEILRLSKIFVLEGVTKIRLTGGEPTIRPDIIDLLSQLKNLRQFGLRDIAITSNGIALKRKLPALVQAGLTHLNLSLDTLDPFRYQLMTRRKGLQTVLEVIDLALQLGIKSLKVNCVVIKGLNDHELLDFVEMTRHKAIEIRFIEYMPFDGNKWQGTKLLSYRDMLSTIRQAHPGFSRDTAPANEIAKTWHVPGHVGSIGFITSMTDHFCDGCNRLRITADGNLKVCLFGNTEISMRDLLRSTTNDTDLLPIISAAVKRKKAKHAGLKELQSLKNRPMILIDNPLLKRKAHTRHFDNLLIAQASAHRNSIRAYSQGRDSRPTLTHLTPNGEARMVSIRDKSTTHRLAIARGSIRISAEAMSLVQQNSVKKGDVLALARVAGIMASKETARLVPLCHNIVLSKAEIDIKLDPAQNIIQLQSTVECNGTTGVEMEALTACSVGLLTIYDMLKAVDKHMVIDSIHVVRKIGGKSDWSMV